MADNLQNLLHLLDETGMIHGLRELDVTEVTRALTHGLGAGFALELTIDGSEQRVVETSITRLDLVLLHRLGVQNVANTHALDLLGRHQAELYLFDRLERRARVGKVKVRHDGGGSPLLLDRKDRNRG